MKENNISLDAFTLAEVLITLVIVGVVAAVTIPVVINKINESKYDRAREKALNTIGEAGKILAVQGDLTLASNAEDFVKNYLSKKLKIVKTCAKDSMDKCGVPKKVTRAEKATTSSVTWTTPKTITNLVKYSNAINNGAWALNKDSYAFLTEDGFSVDLFYNSGCTPDTVSKMFASKYYQAQDSKAADYICMNAIYDMNGLKGPNTVGKDVGFVTVLYPDETVRAVAPAFRDSRVSHDITYNFHSASEDGYTAATVCQSKYGKNYTLPDKDEVLAMIFNAKILTNKVTVGEFWSSSKASNGQYNQWWYGDANHTNRGIISNSYDFYVWCVKR